MSFERQIAGRHAGLPDPVTPEIDASVALQQARTARAAANPRPWAAAFFAQVAETGLTLLTLNDIVAECGTLDEAIGAVARRLSTGEGYAGLRKPAQNDVAARISAAHAKAHQPRRA